MTRTFCDACGKETSSLTKVAIMCHLTSFANDAANSYSDKEGNRVSGRTDSFDLCNRCYNEVMGQAVKKMNELKAK